MHKDCHVAAAPGPLSYLSSSARPLAAALGPESVLTYPNLKYILILLEILN